MLESMNKDGIKFADMDTAILIKRMAEIEEVTHDRNLELQRVDPTSRNRLEFNRPKVIWNLLKENFEEDYFLDVIADEYGIMPKANDFLAQKIKDHFEIDLRLYDEKQEEMVKSFEVKLEQREAEIIELKDENEKLRRQNDKKKDILTRDMRANMKARYEGMYESKIK